MLVVEVTEDSRRVGYFRKTYLFDETEFSAFYNKIFDYLNLFVLEGEIETGGPSESSLFIKFFKEKGIKDFYY
jgi:hypothetical protein